MTDNRVTSSLFNVVHDNKSQMIPLQHLTDNRVTSSLFNVVHDNKRQMNPPSITGGDMLCILVNYLCLLASSATMHTHI